MSIKAGTKDIPTAGTAVQLVSGGNSIQAVIFVARIGNTGNCYLGGDDVSATNGIELLPGIPFRVEFPEGHPGKLNWFYLDAATSGDDVDFFSMSV